MITVEKDSFRDMPNFFFRNSILIRSPDCAGEKSEKAIAGVTSTKAEINLN